MTNGRGRGWPSTVVIPPGTGRNGTKQVPGGRDTLTQPPWELLQQRPVTTRVSGLNCSTPNTTRELALDHTGTVAKCIIPIFSCLVQANFPFL